MSKVDKSTQTTPFRSFRIREMPLRFKRIFKRKLIPNLTSPISNEVRAEEHIINTILSKGRIKVKNEAINVFIKNPFDTESYLYVKEGRLCLTIDCLYKTIKLSNNKGKGKSLVEEFEAVIVNILVSNNHYFDELYRVKEKSTYSITQLIAIFLIYLSKYIEKRVFSCLFDLLFQLFYHLKLRYRDELDKRFKSDYVAKRLFKDLELIKTEYNRNGREWPFHFFKPSEIISLFCDFCALL